MYNQRRLSWQEFRRPRTFQLFKASSLTSPHSNPDSCESQRAMDRGIQLKIEKTVVGILESADMADMTEYKVRKLAGEKLNINLSETHYKKFVRNIVENFLKSRQDEEEQEQDAAEVQAEQKVEAEVEAEAEAEAEVEAEAEAEDEEEEEESPVKKQKKNKKKKIEVSKKASQAGEIQEATIDDNGDIIICKLNSRRNVSIQEFRGNKLVSIREYYEKDGKQLPSSKGISLTIDQWTTFKKNIPAIEEAIQQLQWTKMFRLSLIRHFDLEFL